MSAVLWADARAGQERRLAELVGLPAGSVPHPALSAIASLLVLADAEVDPVLQEHRAMPALRVAPDPAGDPLAQDLLEEMLACFRGMLQESRYSFDPAGWAAMHDVSGLVCMLISSGSGEDVARPLLLLAAEAARTITVLGRRILIEHLTGLFGRDLPGMGLIADRLDVPPIVGWLLAPSLEGSPDRELVVQRRRQAGSLFAAIGRTLMQPDTTAAVDAGLPLLPVLSRQLGLPVGAVRAVRGAWPLQHWDTSRGFEMALAALDVHGVPLAEWPGQGQPDRQEAWVASCWVRRFVTGYEPPVTLFRPDFAAPQAVRDALGAVATDLLRPLVDARLRHCSAPTPAMRGLVDLDGRGLDLAGTPAGIDVGTIRRSLLQAVHEAVIGPRGPHALEEAAERWHRRAAAVAALRDEHQQDLPGWPALCPVWTSVGGCYEIVPLTTAEALVEEGNRLDHCVGGYYETCRHGDTQILSLRRGDERLATIEIRLGQDLDRPTLTVGQFEGLRRCRPEWELHVVLRDFLHDLRSGRQGMNLSALRDFRRRRAREDGPWRSGALPLAHARLTYPLHRVLLPRGSADSFDTWGEKSGLIAAIDAALAALDGTAVPAAVVAA